MPEQQQVTGDSFFETFNPLLGDVRSLRTDGTTPPSCPTSPTTQQTPQSQSTHVHSPNPQLTTQQEEEEVEEMQRNQVFNDNREVVAAGAQP